MGHAEKIIAEIASLNEIEQLRLLAFVESMKAARPASAEDVERQRLSAAPAPFR